MEIISKILLAFLGMAWELFWGLALGFLLSALIRAFVSTETISRKIGKTSVKSIGLSTFFGAISSSCSYAAASMSRTLMMKGASLANSIAFLISSTNLVFEIFIIIFTLLGWSFFMGELIGGLFFILFTAILISRFFPQKAIESARAHMKKNDLSSSMKMDHAHQHEMHEDKKMEHEHHHGHEHEMMQHENQATKEKTFKEKLLEGSQHFVMDVNMVGKDIFIGVLIAAFLMVLVPKTFWESLFLSGNSDFPNFIILLWNAFVGAFIAILSFVCSVGNIVLAAVLWYGGITFGGVIAFILSDLITLPMLQVYRKYYGWKPMLYIFLFLFMGIITTALFLDYTFDYFGWIPENPTESLSITKDIFQWNYQTILNFIFIPLTIGYYWMGKKQALCHL